MTSAYFDAEKIQQNLERVMLKLPKGIQNRFKNTFDHFERAKALFDIDREMCSFRAITGEEEAATALMRVVQIREYEDADRLKPTHHYHKAAIVAAIMAIRNEIYPLLPKFQLTFNFGEGRIDLRIPLSNFGVKSGENYAIQPVEPLGLRHSRQGIEEDEVFDDVLARLAEISSNQSIVKLINDQARARNTLLYASDNGLPKSEATMESINKRMGHAYAMLILTVMVHQSRKHLPMVRQVLQSVLRVV